MLGSPLLSELRAEASPAPAVAWNGTSLLCVLTGVGGFGKAFLNAALLWCDGDNHNVLSL